MSDEELVQPEISETEASGEDRKPAESPAQTSRMERLKRKLKKLQGKDPDIYPMW
ncbi:hypothetical protein [Falsiphaeobacter marinintestinus]|uniref:hypothetical protein n=1 Tax=Falsiphaeobacter marinintestinus TaxID=1492905 RepID=UPI001646A83F|nr:hypothetical protein [Phaeobacter marinintestinus]